MAALNDYLIDQVENSWTVPIASGAASIGTATKTAVPRMSHVVTKVDASFDTSTQSGLLTVSFGATVVALKDIHGAGAWDPGQLGLQADVNTTVTAVLSAGAGAVVGHVTLTGYSTAPKGGNLT
jgi:hypothetical protein